MRLTVAQLRAWGYTGPIPEGRPMALPVEPPKRKPADPPPSPLPTRPHVPGQRWVMVVPGWRPTLDNDLIYRPRWVASSRKRRDTEVVARAALAYGVPRAAGKRRLTLTIRGRYSTFPDDSAPLKSLWDALVKAELLVDDSREWLEFVWPPTFERGKKETVIALEDIS